MLNSPERVQESRGKPLDEVDVLVQRFSNYLQAYQKSPKTQREYVKVVRQWAEWWRKPASAFDQLAWDDWTFHLTEKPLKGQTVRMYQSALRKFYKFLRRQKVVTHDPSQDAESVGIIKRVPQFLSEAEVGLMFDAAKGSIHDTALLEFLYSCGLRNTELRNLPQENIAETHVRVLGKGNKERVVSYSKRVHSGIKAHVEASGRRFYAFGERKGRRIAMMTVQRVIRRLAQSAGITRRVTPHTLRHSIATHLLARGCSLAYIQAFLGHETIETTRIYTHIVEAIATTEILKAHPRG